MNDITVLISGMVLLMAPIAYEQNGSAKIHAAVAVNARAPESSYDVEIPSHISALVFVNKDLGTPVDPNKRLSPDEAPNKTRLELRGDLVQLGVFDNNARTCGPIKDDPSTTDATTAKSMRDLPQMKDLVDNMDLAPDTHPVNKVYVGVSAKKVASWLEIPLGRLRAIHSSNLQNDEVTFRPTHHTGMIAQAVEWHVPAGSADCVLVTAFDQSSRVDIPFKPGKVSFTFENKADMSSGEMLPGFGYDFEVLYGLFNTRPTIPPIPYSVNPPAHDGAPVNASTGVNCGPVTIPSGG